jgi:hypothetical protein
MQPLLLRPAVGSVLCALALCLAAAASAQGKASDRNPFGQPRPLAAPATPETADELFRRRQREMRIPQPDVPAVATSPSLVYPRTNLPPGAEPPPSGVVFAPPEQTAPPAAKQTRALIGQQVRTGRGYYNNNLRMQQRAERFRAAREPDPGK